MAGVQLTTDIEHKGEPLMEVQNQLAITYLRKIESVETSNSIQALNEHNPRETVEKQPLEKLESKIQEINEILETVTTAVKFQLHEKLEVYYVQVINTKTDEVMKEIPQKKFLDMYASMVEFAGVIVDEKY